MLLTIFAIPLAYYQFMGDRTKPLSTYFKYNADALKPLKGMTSSLEITTQELQKLDNIMFDLIRENKIDADSCRIYAYVYTAQRDMAFLSYNLHHKFSGSVEPITKKVLCEFFPKDCNNLKTSNTDKYSEQLANIVFQQVKARNEQDKQHETLYQVKTGSPYWAGTVPYFGQTFGSWKTWMIQSGHQFRAPQPPTESEWQTQLTLVKQARDHVTEEQKKAVVYWAGGPGTITPPGIWLNTTNNYMWDHDTSLEKTILVRSVLAMGLADSIASVFDSKYTYFQKRPFMRDHNIQPIMPTPNHPSYPAAHSALSGTAEVILIHYFPEAKNQWLKLANEGSKSRVWGGIHFDIDTEAGFKQGGEVGDFVIKTVSDEK